MACKRGALTNQGRDSVLPRQYFVFLHFFVACPVAPVLCRLSICLLVWSNEKIPLTIIRFVRLVRMDKWALRVDSSRHESSQVDSTGPVCFLSGIVNSSDGRGAGNFALACEVRKSRGVFVVVFYSYCRGSGCIGGAVVRPLAHSSRHVTCPRGSRRRFPCFWLHVHQQTRRAV